MSDGWCYGPVLCDRQSDGTVQMECVWVTDGTPCPWTATAANTITAAVAGRFHARTH